MALVPETIFRGNKESPETVSRTVTATHRPDTSTDTTKFNFRIYLSKMEFPVRELCNLVFRLFCVLI